MSAVAAEELLVDEVATLARAYAESQTFVSLLAHELRTRLAVTQRALDSLETDDRVDVARASTRQLQELVESLLAIARGGDGSFTDAGTAAANVVDDLRASGELDDAEVIVGDLPAVRLPRALLETVLHNLVVNALEAGASTVEIFGRPSGTVCVRDDGPGVSPRNTERIFGVFSTKFGGAGLGLALVREILRRRNGDIWLEPPSTFAFRVQ
jgi:signal transduction histidine kinase